MMNSRKNKKNRLKYGRTEVMTYAVKNEDGMKSSKIVFEDKDEKTCYNMFKDRDDRVEDMKMLKTRINKLGRNVG